MFIGHYGAAFAAKRAAPTLSLGVFFLAVQFLDLLFMSLVLLGIEKVRIVPGFTAYNGYELLFMPYSHSLIAATGWSVVVGGMSYAIFYNLPTRARLLASVALGAAVLSHFVLDVPMHTPDLPIGLADDSSKLGAGLWNHRGIALAFEAVVVVAGFVAYWRTTTPSSPRSNLLTNAFFALLAVFTFATPFLPDPTSPAAMAIQALLAYGALALFAWHVDRHRAVRGAAQDTPATPTPSPST